MSTWASDEFIDLPDIEARTFDVKIEKNSRSKRVFLLSSPREATPNIGRILLFKRNDQPVVAMRVLKIYSKDETFAAKILKRYDEPTLEIGDSFLAVEKISDVIPPPPSAQDQADLQEVEGPTPAAEPAARPPRPGTDENLPHPEGDELSRSEALDQEESESEDGLRGLAVQETPIFDRYRHWVTAGFGYMLNGGSYFSGAGFRYAYTVWPRKWLRKANLQDSFVAEGGVFFYKALNVKEIPDAYTVIPLVGTARYNIHFSENMSVFAYLGATFNWAMANSYSNPTKANEAMAELFNLMPAVGGGLMLRVGPNWDLRVDLGYDVLMTGLVLRF